MHNERGSSYPDMDKLIKMCKILDCTLEELMDDDVIGNKNLGNNKFSFSSYLDEFLKFITKSFNMFSSMKFKEKIKCLLEHIFILLFLLLIGNIILSVAESITFELLKIMPYNIEDVLCNIFNQLYLIGLIILGVIIFIHIFKVRYLDYFVTVEDSTVSKKVLEEKVDTEEEMLDSKEKEKIIIRDPKHASFNFFNLLTKVIHILIKCLLGIVLMPLLLIFILLITGVVVIIYHISYGSLFLYLAMIGIGIVAIIFLLIKIFFNFIVSKRNSYKTLFIVFISSIVIIGTGMGLSLISLTQYNQINSFDELRNNVYTEYLDIADNIYISPYDANVEYIVDNSLDNIKIEIYSVDGVNYNISKYNEGFDNSTKFYDIYISDINYSKIYEMFLNDLKEKKFRSYNNPYYDYIKIKVYVSESNLLKIRTNY